jgi:aromatic-L-amino-acid decarboxylase
VAGLAADQLRLIDTDENFAMNPQALSAAIAQDQSDGLVPFFVMATVGTTSSGAVDPLPKIAPLAKAAGAWLHVDAAWAGSAGVCPEYREIFTGLDQADSYVFNPHKWLLTNFDCSLFWVADAGPLTEALSIVPEYLRNPASEAGAVIDYRDWQVPLGRRFRSLKLWFVLRSYGVEGLQAHIRRHVDAAQDLARQVAQHPKLELVAPPTLALVCFRHLDGDQASEDLLQALNATGEVLLTHTKLNDRYVLRVAVGATQTTQSHVQHLMDLIAEQLSS